MPPRGLSRAATLPIIAVDHSFEEKAKLRKSLAHISTRSLARSISKIEIESTQHQPTKAAAVTTILPAIPESESESNWVDILNNKLAALSELSNLSTVDFEAYETSDEFLADRYFDWLKRESLLQQWEAEEKRLTEAGPEEEEASGFTMQVPEDTDHIHLPEYGRGSNPEQAKRSDSALREAVGRPCQRARFPRRRSIRMAWF